MSLTRRTALTRSGPIARKAPIPRARMTPSPPPERDWRDARRKALGESGCRICCLGPAEGVTIEVAHTIGCTHDRAKPHPEVLGPDGPLWVDPLDTVPLCTAHHRAYDARDLNLLPYLSKAEQAAAVRHVGIVAALRRLTSSRKDPS